MICNMVLATGEAMKERNKRGWTKKKRTKSVTGFVRSRNGKQRGENIVVVVVMLFVWRVKSTPRHTKRERGGHYYYIFYPLPAREIIKYIIKLHLHTHWKEGTVSSKDLVLCLFTLHSVPRWYMLQDTVICGHELMDFDKSKVHPTAVFPSLSSSALHCSLYLFGKFNSFLTGTHSLLLLNN